MYKAVFIDMDGTLLRTNHTVSDNSKKVIQHLLSIGVVVVPISARPLHGILPIIKEVLPDSMPVVSLNGGYIFHNKEIIYETNIALPEVISIYNALQPYNVSVMYYSRMEWFAVADSTLIKKEQKITDVKIKIQPFAQMVKRWEADYSGPNKILIAGNKLLIREIENKLLRLHGLELNIFKSQPAYLEVMNQQASKAKAIEILLNKYGIDQSEIIAIGDNFNDQGMIEFAGTGIAMGNAPDEIKLVADYVTDTNNNDGVAKALNHFFKFGLFPDIPSLPRAIDENL